MTKKPLLLALTFISSLLICLPILKADAPFGATDIARSQREAKARYQGFIDWLRQQERQKQIFQSEINKLKSLRDIERERKEQERQTFIDKRAGKQKISGAELDRLLEELRDKDRDQQKRMAKTYRDYLERKKEALKAVPKVDPHDEFEVGHNYDEEELESEGDEEEK